MGLTASKCPEMAQKASLEASSAPCLAQCSRTELYEAELLINAYDKAWYGESSSSALHTALDYWPPTTPRKQPGQAVYCSSPTSPVYDSPPPRHVTASRQCSLPLTVFDNMDDLTEFGQALHCNADWLPNVKKPNGVVSALAANSPAPGQQYKQTSSWTFLPDIPQPILRSLSDPNPTNTHNSSLQSCPAAAQQHLPNLNSKHRRTRTSSTGHHQTATQKMRCTADAISSGIRNWWLKTAAGKVAAAAHHTFWSPLATSVQA